jgi:hypothetical protein
VDLDWIKNKILTKENINLKTLVDEKCTKKYSTSVYNYQIIQTLYILIIIKYILFYAV